MTAVVCTQATAAGSPRLAASARVSVSAAGLVGGMGIVRFLSSNERRRGAPGQAGAPAPMSGGGSRPHLDRLGQRLGRGAAILKPAVPGDVVVHPVNRPGVPSEDRPFVD